ncbi:hypothetical protein TherJR_2825 [Thermincola potens JR]|uniref:Uncharacterized protein n=1 Tax=Thermincola potens (strain JR) TaxID=635013 RepID=D5XCY1_THEPJ|nr:hypothetical protein TherJR_2825 [Thermincola potens JR]
MAECFSYEHLRSVKHSAFNFFTAPKKIQTFAPNLESKLYKKGMPVRIY